MLLDKQLNYQPYHHKYKENEILILKDIEELNEINKILACNENTDAYIGANWYLSKEKMKLLSAKRLRVLNCVSWHMGVPFYVLEEIDERSNIVHVGEFYLNNNGDY